MGKEIVGLIISGFAAGLGCLAPAAIAAVLVFGVRKLIAHGKEKREDEERRSLAREVATTSRLVVRKTRRPILLDPEVITIIGSSDMTPAGGEVYFKVGHEKVGPTHAKVYIKRNLTTTDSWFIQGMGGGPIEFKEGAGPWVKVRGRRKLKDGWILRLGGAGGPELEVKII